MMTESIAYFGLAVAAAATLIFLSKFCLSKLLQKAPDYYEAAELREERQLLDAAGLLAEGREEGEQ